MGSRKMPGRSGTLVCDQYAGYDRALDRRMYPQRIAAHCVAHARPLPDGIDIVFAPEPAHRAALADLRRGYSGRSGSERPDFAGVLTAGGLLRLDGPNGDVPLML